MSEAAKLKVLIIEDESIVAMMIEDLIVDMGHEVVGTAGRLEQAQKMAEELTLDFAIVDVNLNGQLTYPVAEVLKTRGVPFVFATGYGAQGLKDEWKQNSVLQKPFQPDELTRAIDAVAKG
ncbi:MAG TPA: response regulator [Candidatus Binatia bacterium]|nr:response regulator [Candidatus Binatia bacterium]